METKDLELLVSLYVDGELSERLSAQAAKLIKNDAKAAELYDSFMTIRHNVRSFPVQSLPADFSQKVIARIKTQSARPVSRTFRIRFLNQKIIFTAVIVSAVVLLLLVPLFLLQGTDTASSIAQKIDVKPEVQQKQLDIPERPLASSLEKPVIEPVPLEIVCSIKENRQNESGNPSQKSGSQFNLFVARFEQYANVNKILLTKGSKDGQLIYEISIDKSNSNEMNQLQRLVNWLTSQENKTLVHSVLSQELLAWQKTPVAENNKAKIENCQKITIIIYSDKK